MSFNYKIFDYIPENQFFDFAKNVFPLLIQEGQRINVYPTNEYWCDIGSISQYQQTHQDVFNEIINIDGVEINDFYNSQLIKGKNIQFSSNVKLIGNNTIGSNCRFDDNVIIENSIIYDNVKIVRNSIIKNCIIAENSIIAGNLTNQVTGANLILENTLEEIKR